jgi:hypothetical protein
MERHGMRTAVIGWMVLNAAGCSGETLLAEGTHANIHFSVPDFGNTAIQKIDFLLVVDNSPSMADKQRVLALAVPELVARFANPVCIEPASGKQVGVVPPGAMCDQAFPGTRRQLDPIRDIHIGVITSSLGGHGADTCSEGGSGPRHGNDAARLIDRGVDAAGNDVAVQTYANAGFLNWDPAARSYPPGENDLGALRTTFSNLVRGAGQDGCGFEASLEAWYRFLVDPAPHLAMVPTPCHEGDSLLDCREPQGIDEVVLAQRHDFLRPDSLLVIVMLTDENDCSLRHDPQSYLALQANDGTAPFHLSRGTEACLTDPWSPDCKSCREVSVVDYPECSDGWIDPAKDDPLSLRCFEQQRRFGLDFLHPVRRYIDAMTDPRLDDGTLNPVFCKETTDATRTTCAAVMRDPSRVYLAGIVGVPWQDIAIDPDDLAQGFRPSEQLSWTPSAFTERGMTAPRGLRDGKTLWNSILGEVDERPGTDKNGDGMISASEKNPRYGAVVPTVQPLDPLMRESVDPRDGEHPATGHELVQPGDGDPAGHPVNGSERAIEKRDDLQYACVFDLGDLGPRDCSDGDLGCDCAGAPENPLCWDVTTGTYGTLQYRAKAYPSRRQLAVLKGLDSQGIVASVCPANLRDATAGDYGYLPAIAAIVDRLVATMAPVCMQTELTIRADGSVDCELVEATRDGASGNVACPPCEGVRGDVSPDVRKSIEADPIYVQNGFGCMCALRQTPPGPELRACVSEPTVSGIEGWCYVDPGQREDHDAQLVANCPAGTRRTIRFVGNVPAPDASTFLRCRGGSG